MSVFPEIPCSLLGFLNCYHKEKASGICSISSELGIWEASSCQTTQYSKNLCSEPRERDGEIIKITHIFIIFSRAGMSGSSRHSAASSPKQIQISQLELHDCDNSMIKQVHLGSQVCSQILPNPTDKATKGEFPAPANFLGKKTKTSSHQQNSALKAARWYPWKLSFRQQRLFIFLQLLWFGQRFMDFEFSSRQARLPDLIYKAPPVTAFLGRRGALPLLLPRLCAFWSITTQFPSSLETSLKHSPRSGAERSLAWHRKNLHLKFPEISIL